MHKCVPSTTETQGDATPYKVFVGGLGDKIDETTLREALSPFGTVTKVSLIRQPDGQSRGFAFVHFTEAAPVEMLIQRQNMNVNGRKVFFGSANSKKNRGVAPSAYRSDGEMTHRHQYNAGAFKSHY